MALIYLPDTNARIGYLRRKPVALVQRFLQTDPADIRLCSVVLGELLYGVYHGPASYQAHNPVASFSWHGCCDLRTGIERVLTGRRGTVYFCLMGTLWPPINPTDSADVLNEHDVDKDRAVFELLDQAGS